MICFQYGSDGGEGDDDDGDDNDDNDDNDDRRFATDKTFNKKMAKQFTNNCARNFIDVRINERQTTVGKCFNFIELKCFENRSENINTFSLSYVKVESAQVIQT